MSEARLEARVGAAMMAVFAGITLLLLLGGVSVSPTIGVTVRLSHPGGLQEGAPVMVAGRTIGRVGGIALDRARGGVLLHTRLDRVGAAMTSINGAWFVNAKGVLGERYLEVGPPDGELLRERPAVDGDVVRGVDPPQLDRLAAIGLSNITQMRLLARELLPEARALGHALDDTARLLDELEPSPGALGRSWRAQRELAAELRAWSQALDAAGVDGGALLSTASRAGGLLARVRGESGALRARADRLGDELTRVRGQIDPARLARFEAALAQARDVATRSERVIAGVDDLVARVLGGRGTIGGFLNDHELRDIGKQLGKILKRRGWEVLGRPPR